MYAKIGNDLTALKVACDLCGLDLIEGQRWFCTSSEVIVGPEWVRDRNPRCDHAITLKPEHALQCSRQPHQVGVFWDEDTMWLIWDPVKDGFGLLAFIGVDGERLLISYLITAALRAAERMELGLGSCVTDENNFTTLEFNDPMSQKRIIMRVSPKGLTTLRTEGFEGSSCKEATAELEKALGSVVSDTPTDESYRTAQQQVTTTGE